MEHFVVSARKYRPQTFKDVVGQQAITNTLANAITNNHLAQALLFTGPRGVGKTTCARILAKMINQDDNQSPDEDFAFNIFELDAASNNSVDDIRNLIDQVRIPPQVGKYKVYIIDEVHMLSASAFNAFLKTLEEPPKHAIFILATTEKHKIIPTILSRCQIFDFKRITVTDAKEYLKHIAEQEGIIAEDDALQIIAQKADGAMRDALSIYDRVVSFSGNNLTRQAVTENLNVLDYDTYMKITDLLLTQNIPELLVRYNDILASGFDGHHFIAGLASHFRDLLVCKDQRTIQLLEVGEQTKAKYFEQSQQASQEFLMEAIRLANDCDLNYKTSRNQRLLVELCLMQMASIQLGAQKKNEHSQIISPKEFTQPAKPISSEEKKIIRDNEHDENPVTKNVQEKPSTEPVKKEEIPTLENKVDTSNYISKEIPQNTEIKQEVNKQQPSHNEAPKTKPVTDNSIAKKKVSGLSLASIRKKKELEAQAKTKTVAEETVMTNAFTETQLQATWDDYVHKLKKRGEKILASILETDLPKLKNDHEIHLELPAESMKIDMKRGQNKLMAFLKKQLKNTTISLHIDVNEKSAKKFAFTPIEKYNKLKEKNPLLDKLRTTFDLDV